MQADEAIRGIRMFLSFLPAAGTLLSILFIGFYPLSEKRMKTVTAELEERRKNIQA